MQQLRIGIFQVPLDGTQTIKTQSTYLDILQTSNSEQTKTYMGYDNPSNPAVTQVGLKDYDKLLEEAGNETSDLNKRYEKYAAAQAW